MSEDTHGGSLVMAGPGWDFAGDERDESDLGLRLGFVRGSRR